MTVNLAVNTAPLESGDRLTRPEFERRYTNAPEIHKAELIEGVVYVASPVRATRHSSPHALIMAWLIGYWTATPGVDPHIDATVRLDEDNEPQPDALLRIKSEAIGNSIISADDYIEGAPELVVEIAASSASYDMNAKLNAYRRNGVKEYIVWQIYENKLDWFILKDSLYIPLEPDASGVIRSQVFPGLWLAVESLRERNLQQLIAVLQQGLQTPEHQEFVQRLRQ